MIQRGDLLQRARHFFVSPWGLAAQFCIAALVVVFDAQVAGLFMFAALFLAILVVCDDILATMAPFVLTTLFLVKSNNNVAYARYSRFWWIIIFAAAAVGFHLWAYQRGKKLLRGKATWALIGAAAACTLGGLGFISSKEYFAGVSLYHMGALGVGMLVAYLFLSMAVKEDTSGQLPVFVANVMVMIGLFAAFMVFHHYVANLPQVLEHKQILAFQWRNNASTYLMLALPFPFYKAFRKPPCLIAALLMYLAILLTGSRGGMLFGTVELAMCVLFVLLADKRRRLFYLLLAGALTALLIAALPLLFGFFWPVMQRFLEGAFAGEQEVRMGLYQRAVQDFLSHPVLGTGLGYMGNRDVHPSKEFALCWYHCAPLQIIGSMGIMGALAYAYYYFVRLKIFLRRRSNFHLTLFLSWVGLEMMSLVNPGVFAPLPYLLLATMYLVFAEKTEASPGPVPLQGIDMNPSAD